MTVIRAKTIKGHTYYYEQASHRVNGKVVTQHLRYLGKNPSASSSPIGGYSGSGGSDKKLGTTKQKQVALITKAKRELFKDRETKIQIKAYERLAKKGIDTKSMHTDPTTGKYTPERLKIHKDIIDKYSKMAAPSKRKPTVVFLGGAPGSGKSVVVLKKIDTKGYIVLDNDAVKRMLPEHKGINAMMLHEEASDIVDTIRREALKKRKNIVLDATLKNYEKAKKQMKTFKEAGYTVKLHGTNVSTEVTIDRAIKRFHKRGRYVPIEYIAENVEKINVNVRRLTKEADEYIIYDTSRDKKFKEKIIMQSKELGTTTRAIIRQGDKYLVVQRKGSDVGGGRWQFVGGGVDGGDPIKALRREVKEETNLKIVGKPKKQKILHNKLMKKDTYYYNVDVEGDIKLQESELQDYKWVTKEELSKLKLTEGASNVLKKNII